MTPDMLANAAAALISIALAAPVTSCLAVLAAAYLAVRIN